VDRGIDETPTVFKYHAMKAYRVNRDKDTHTQARTHAQSHLS